MTHADLQLSGHSSGQIRIPLLGAPYLPAMEQEIFTAGSDGLARSLYANVGLGTIVVPMRLDCPPEVTLITLRRARSAEEISRAARGQPMRPVWNWPRRALHRSSRRQHLSVPELMRFRSGGRLLHHHPRATRASVLGMRRTSWRVDSPVDCPSRLPAATRRFRLEGHEEEFEAAGHAQLVIHPKKIILDGVLTARPRRSAISRLVSPSARLRTTSISRLDSRLKPLESTARTSEKRPAPRPRTTSAHCWPRSVL